MVTNGEKYRQIRREAAATGVGLLMLIAFWIFAGFGLADVRGEVFHLPLWAVAGTIGTWCFAILLVKFLTSVVFKDMSLEDDAAAASAKGDGKRG